MEEPSVRVSMLPLFLPMVSLSTPSGDDALIVANSPGWELTSLSLHLFLQELD